MSNIRLFRSWLSRIFAGFSGCKTPPVSEGGIISADNNDAVKAFVEDQIKTRTFRAVLNEHDEMYIFALGNHKGNKDRAWIEVLATGKQSLNVVRKVVDWKFGGFSKLSGFLDFASGYGRLTRFLVGEFSPERIWVCDIYPEAVRFQAKQFGVHGLISAMKPQNYRDARKYDCIFVASLFSHLPEETFVGWLRKLYGLLTPSGVLIFSVHDVAVLPPHMKSDGRGIVFIADSESLSLDKNIYGTTYVDESFVRGAIVKVTGRPEYHRTRRGLWSFQDVYVISKDKGVDYSGLDVSQGPAGYLEVCRLTENGDVHFEGWAADFSKNGGIRDVQVLVNGQSALKCAPTNERFDVEEAFQDSKGLQSGFSCDLDKNLLQPGDIILVKIVDTDGVEHVLRAGQLESILDT